MSSLDAEGWDMTRTHSTTRATRARWLRRIREDRRLTQAKLAHKVGVTTNAISRYENGHDDPSLDVFDRLLTELHCWYIDLQPPIDGPIPPPRLTPRPFGKAYTGLAQAAIDEFAQPTRKPEQYPDRLRCWNCHGRPGECQCWTQCKVCRLLFRRGGKCSGILHLLFALVLIPCLIDCPQPVNRIEADEIRKLQELAD